MMHGGDVWQGKAPGDWLDFSANIRPGGAPEWVRAALRQGLEEVSFYPDPRMRRERAALAAALGLEEGCVLPTAGGISALDLASRLGEGEVLIPAPSFSEYEYLARKRGREVRRVPLLGADGRPGSPAQMLAGRIPRGALVFFGNPNNPLGSAFPAAEVLELLRAVEEAEGWLVVDEAFIGYCPEKSVRGAIAEHERLLVAGSMTKILGIPGARLGYLCAQPPVLERLAAGQLTWELNCMAAAVARALPAHLDDLRAEAERSARRRAALKEDLEALGAFVQDSEAPFLLARFAFPVAPLARALRAEGILVRECADFPGVDDGRHLRLAVKDEAANRRLTEAIREAWRCGEKP